MDQFQIEEIFHPLCGGAVHAHQTEHAQGFLTTPSGCREGVAGTLSPQVILLDELGTLAETAALEQGFYSGVDFVASVHAASVEEAARRPQVQALQRHGMLRVFVLLHGCTTPGKVRQVCTV